MQWLFLTPLSHGVGPTRDTYMGPIYSCSETIFVKQNQEQEDFLSQELRSYPTSQQPKFSYFSVYAVPP